MILTTPMVAQEIKVAKIKLKVLPSVSLSTLLYTRWGIGKKGEPYNLYGSEGWVQINDSLSQGSKEYVYVPAELVRPDDDAVMGIRDESGAFVAQGSPTVTEPVATPTPLPSAPPPIEEPEPKPKPKQTPTLKPEPAPAEQYQKAKKTRVLEDSSYKWEVSGTFAIAQTTQKTSADGSEPIDRQEITGEGIGLYIQGPWGSFFSWGIGPSIALTSVNTKQTQSISDGFSSEEKKVKTEQSIYSLGIRNHFYFRELGGLRSVPFLGIGFRYSTGTESETDSDDVNLNGYSFTTILGYHIPLLDAVSLTPDLRYEVFELERDESGDTTKETTSGFKFGLGLSVFF